MYKVKAETLNGNVLREYIVDDDFELKDNTIYYRDENYNRRIISIPKGLFIDIEYFTEKKESE